MMIIHYFHTNKLVYRDLKPKNVMIDENKNAIIIDFDRMLNLKTNSTFSNYTVNFLAAHRLGVFYLFSTSVQKDINKGISFM